MKTRLLYLIIVFTLILTSACTTGTAAAQASAVAPDNQAADIQIADEQTQPPNPEQPEGQGQAPGGGTPPDAAYAACSAQSEGDACEFTSQKGVETGLCEMVQDQLACSPQRGPAGADQNNGSGPVNPDQGEANGSTTPGQGNGGQCAKGHSESGKNNVFRKNVDHGRCPEAGPQEGREARSPANPNPLVLISI